MRVWQKSESPENVDSLVLSISHLPRSFEYSDIEVLNYKLGYMGAKVSLKDNGEYRSVQTRVSWALFKAKKDPFSFVPVMSWYQELYFIRVPANRISSFLQSAFSRKRFRNATMQTIMYNMQACYNK